MERGGNIAKLRVAFLAAFVAVATGGTHAASSGVPASLQGYAPAWDCWVDAGEGGGLRCIEDRDLPRPSWADVGDVDDEASETLLELIHGHLHRGDPGRASELVREVAHLIRRGDVWTVPLGAPPIDSSWRDARPERLVRALLCRREPGCAVRFHR